MKKSFVLKDCAGRPSGYLMQMGDHVRCRIQTEEPAQVTLLFSDGSRVSCDADGREITRSYPGRMLSGGYAWLNGQLLCCTDEAAARAFDRECAAQKREKAYEAQTPHIEAPHIEAQQARADDGAYAREEETTQNVLPERRWPPPCCMPARYIGGQWQEVQI